MPTALSLLDCALGQRHVQTRGMSSTAMLWSARCCHYSPTAGRETDSGKLKLVPFDRVAVGRYRPTAPTDPYVRTLAHTVPRVMVSLRA